MIELLPEVEVVRNGRRLDPLGAQLELVRDMTGREVLLESWDGEVVAHALGSSASSTICAAVLSRSSLPLRAALRESRKVALAAAGAVSTGLVDGQTATVVPVPGAPVATGDGAGRLWFLGPEVTPVDAALQAAIKDLGALATRLSQVQHIDVSELIVGKQELTTGFATGGTYLLVAHAGMPSGVAVETLRRGLRQTSEGLLIHVGVHDNTDVAVICSSQKIPVETISARLASKAIVHNMRCVLTEASAIGLSAAFQQTRQVLRSAPVGCHHPAQLRSRVFVRLITDAIGESAHLAEDPVAGLVVGNPEFARALLAWLDTHGDAAAAAAALGCHVNTIRYRLRRAGELLTGDLHDPTFRLEVHLRLLAALRKDRTP